MLVVRSTMRTPPPARRIPAARDTADDEANQDFFEIFGGSGPEAGSAPIGLEGVMTVRLAILTLLSVLGVTCVLAMPPSGAGAAPEQAWQWQTPLVRFEPQPGTTVIVDGVGELRGTVELRRQGGGIAVINELPLDEYLLGLGEVPSTWPAAALEAQAIAARTFAVRTAYTPSSAPHRAAGADICATEACQVYDGVDRERRDVGGAWAAAVRSTSNRVLLYEGAPILAKYASSNGGQSEDGGYPYLPAVNDPDDAAVSPHATWQSTVSLTEIERAVPGAGRLVEVNRAGDVVVLRREQPDGTLLDEGLAPLAFRHALNRGVSTPPGVPVPVPSHRFVARTQDGVVVLDGSGYGHLVGMSQYGALGKAQRGMSADDILASYYAGIRPTGVDAGTLPALIRVAVALDVPQVLVRPSGGRFRVRAADGAAIAQLAGGEWQATPEAGELRISGAAAPSGLQAKRIRPDTIRMSLGVAARVEVLDPAVRSLGVLDEGSHDVPVANIDRVAVVADAGGGRVDRVDLGRPPPHARPVTVAAPLVAEEPPRAPARGPQRVAPVLVAALVVALAAAATARVHRAPRRPTAADQRPSM